MTFKIMIVHNLVFERNKIVVILICKKSEILNLVIRFLLMFNDHATLLYRLVRYFV